MNITDGLMNNLEAKRHIGAGITIRHRENINPVYVFATLKKMPNTGGQTPHHAGCINVSNSLVQNLKPGKKEPAKSLACRESNLGEKSRVLAGLTRSQ